MKLYIELNTDRCTRHDATEINEIVNQALSNAMDTVAVQLGIPSNKKFSVGEVMTITFNVG